MQYQRSLTYLTEVLDFQIFFNDPLNTFKSKIK